MTATARAERSEPAPELLSPEERAPADAGEAAPGAERSGGDTIVAVATAPGPAAIGLVRISGAEARVVAGRIVKAASPVEELPPRLAVRGRAHAAGLPLDEVVVTVFKAPASYTGEDLVEISAHGSPYILSRIVESACAQGARPARPGEFTLRAFLNGKMDLAQAEGVGALIRARTDLSHRAALNQLSGGLSRQVRELRETVLDLLARVEAQIDHADEGVPLLAADEAARELEALGRRLAALAADARAGTRLAEGVRVVLVGPPNAGKSSLLNALLGRERAIVLDSPGTTRDALEEAADLGGLPAVLVDTAGLREGALDPVERIGMERTRAALASADVALCLFDRSQTRGPADDVLAAEVLAAARGSGASAVAVLNKSDLPPAAGWSPPGGFRETVEVSALTGAGLAGLVAAVHRTAGFQPSGVDALEGLATAAARHNDALARTGKAFDAAARALKTGAGEEIAAVPLREALAALGEILGEGGAEELLGAIFSRFCIGK